MVHLVDNNIAWALFLEPGTEASSAAESCLNAAIETFQPAPSMMHVELLFCDDRRRLQGFATYLGAAANFSGAFGNQREFYLGNRAGKWRAVPFVISNGAALTAECYHHVDTPYSLRRYLFSVPPVRAISFMLPDTPLAPGHCATVSARLIRRVDGPKRLVHASAWYAPSTLFLEVTNEKNRLAARTELLNHAPTVENQAFADVMCRGSDESVERLSESERIGALRLLSETALADDVDDTKRAISQRLLATGLLRCLLLQM